MWLRAPRQVHNRAGPPGLVPRELDGDACVEPQHANRSTWQPRALQRTRADRNRRAPYTTRAGPPRGIVAQRAGRTCMRRTAARGAAARIAALPRGPQRSRADRNPRAPYTTRAGPPGGLVPRRAGRRRMRRTAAPEPQHAPAARIAAQPRGSRPARRTQPAQDHPAGWFGADRPVFSLKRWADQCAEQLDDRRLPGVREPG